VLYIIDHISIICNRPVEERPLWNPNMHTVIRLTNKVFSMPDKRSREQCCLLIPLYRNNRKINQLFHTEI